MKTLAQSTMPTPGWNAALTNTEHTLLYVVFSVTTLALFAMIGWVYAQRRKIASAYTISYTAAIAVLSVAALSYVLLIVKFIHGYDAHGQLWMPHMSDLFGVPVRYVDWAITVPLLVVELIGVSIFTGLKAYRLRLVGMISGFLMVFFGYVGSMLVANGYDMGARIGYGLVSTIFFAGVYAIVIYALIKSVKALRPEIGRRYYAASVVLMATWFAYPLMYGLTGLFHGSWVVVTVQLVYSIADILSKIGFGALIISVAKFRTVHDIATAPVPVRMVADA